MELTELMVVGEPPKLQSIGIWACTILTSPIMLLPKLLDLANKDLIPVISVNSNSPIHTSLVTLTLERH
jgi:hypothetical protein